MIVLKLCCGCLQPGKRSANRVWVFIKGMCEVAGFNGNIPNGLTELHVCIAEAEAFQHLGN